MSSSQELSSVTDDNEDTEFIYKNIPFIENETITFLGECMDRITVLKLEFCNLSAEQIETLANLLMENNSVREVSVNGNPNKEQNFYLLLHETKIIMLSLKFCCINSTAIEKISDELYSPYGTNLLHLNLSSNSLGNNGAQHVARFLRVNRTLISLNLADNKIYDKGCLEIMESLQIFPLNFEEIVVRRRIKFNIERSCLETHSQGSNKNNSQESNKYRPSISDAVTHPFMWDTFDENQQIHCQGNDTLNNLNLSYNRIAYNGLVSIVHMLQYQIKNYSSDKGISRISVEGNDFKCCEELLPKLTELLELKLSDTNTFQKRKSRISLRKIS